jgi:hypothetical protein
MARLRAAQKAEQPGKLKQRAKKPNTHFISLLYS